MVRASIKRQRGALLLAVVGVILVVALSAFAVMALQASQRALAASNAAPARLSAIDAALAQFVARNRRLPCPASGLLADGALNAGVEAINLANGQCLPANQSNGVVPWVTLGLSADQTRDAWQARITYRVQAALASNVLTLMNMSWCDPAGSTAGATGLTAACTPAPCTGGACMHPSTYLYGKGLQVQDGSGGWRNQPAPAWTGPPTPPPPSSGAAYVLISHGSNGVGGYDSNGALHAGAAGNSELPNRNGLALSPATIFIDRAPVATTGVTYFDDVLSHPTLQTVLEQAGLAARTPH